MILKNESRIVERLVDSVAPHIGYYVICDTGSTDDTVERVRSRFTTLGVDGEIHSIPFLNFGQARNDALELGRSSRAAFDYFLLADADMELIVDNPPFSWNLSEPAYSVKQQCRALSYYNTRLVRKDVVATYVGATHEYLDVAGVTRLSGVQFRDYACGSNRVDKISRDTELLLAALANDPDDARTMFYLAQTCREAKNFREAAAWYKLRTGAGGFAEEAWYARYQLALCYQSMGDWSRFVFECLRAFSERPSRAEPLHALARYYTAQAQPDAAQLFLEAAEKILYPMNDKLFIDEKVYSNAIAEELNFAALSLKDPDRPEPDPPGEPFVQRLDQRPIIRIYCGAKARFSPEMIDQARTPIAGSELATMCMAKEFARLGCRVVVYSGVNGIYDGVFYRTAQRFDHRRYSDVLISWRLPALFATERPNAKLTVLWAHDTYFPFRVTGHGKNEIPQEWVDRIDKVVVLSSFHESYIRDIHKNIAGKTWISRNGINQAEYLNRNVDKVPYRYFYSSDWVRGLEEILEIWPDVKEAIPEAELHVAYSIDLCSVRYVNQEWKLEEIYGRLKSMPGLVCHDRLGHQELADLQLSCEAWLYPPQQNSADGGFLETYCISALEAQAAGCVPFSRLNGALPETLKSRTTWEKDFTAKDVIRILNAIHEDWNSHNMQEMLRTNRDWALSQTWESLATEWLTEFGCDR